MFACLGLTDPVSQIWTMPINGNILVQNRKDCSWFPRFLQVCVCVCVCVCVWTWGCMVGYEEREVIILDKLENLNHAVNVEDSQNFLVHVVLFYRKLLL